MEFRIKGRIWTEKVSRQEVRAILAATASVLNYHGKSVINPKKPVTIHFTDKDLGKTKTGSKAVAEASRKNQRIDIENSPKDFSSLATILIHEMIHLFIKFDEAEREKLTSTLTAKLKPDIVRIANILVDGTQQRAAYLAHTKIAYKPESDDFYDDDQFHRNHETSHGIKYRRGQ